MTSVLMSLYEWSATHLATAGANGAPVLAA
jgi:hypothetical protein